MRYNPEPNNSPLTLETTAQPSPVINLYPPGPTSVFNQTPTYSPDGGGSFYTPSSHIFPTSIDVRSRLASSGMAHAPRSTTLPHPGAQISTRDIYSTSTPSFRRAPEHTPRSPSFPSGLRRHPISPTPSPSLGFTTPLRMDTGFGSKSSQQNIPPLGTLQSLGVLSYAEGGTPIKIEINGTIDKGFFEADNEWTCYRRNYFSCICSYNLSPHYPNAAVQFTPTASTQVFQVYGFAMCISAVVADNEGHVIDLVQHTPKRDKGPIAPPEKVRLSVKPPQTQHHPLSHFNQSDMAMPGPSRVYEQGYGQQQGSYPSEHTFERIQFKQATANNGKRRAAQQYYHLLVELWAEVGAQGGDKGPYVRVAYRKSAKMIVRGRSPGHYQSERRGSTSSGPGGSGGSMGGYGGGGAGLGGEYTTSGVGLHSAGYGNTYDSRIGGHYRTHHHEIPLEPILSQEESKAITEVKDYQYYPGAIYESNPDPRTAVEMFSHHQRNDGETAPPHMTGGLDTSAKVKTEYEGGLPSLFYPGQSFLARGCGRYEGKSSSSGYYPMMMPPPAPSSGLNMT